MHALPVHRKRVQPPPFHHRNASGLVLPCISIRVTSNDFSLLLLRFLQPRNHRRIILSPANLLSRFACLTCFLYQQPPLRLLQTIFRLRLCSPRTTTKVQVPHLSMLSFLFNLHCSNALHYCPLLEPNLNHTNFSHSATHWFHHIVNQLMLSSECLLRQRSTSFIISSTPVFPWFSSRKLFLPPLQPHHLRSAANHHHLNTHLPASSSLLPSPQLLSDSRYFRFCPSLDPPFAFPNAPFLWYS